MWRMPDSTLNRLILTAVVLLVAAVAKLLLTLLIRHSVALITQPKAVDLGARAAGVLVRAGGVNFERQTQRMRTLGSLLNNIANVTIGGIAAFTALAIWGVPMGPLLASAGIGGVAVGFGAQSLVRDYLTGIFMLSEDQFGVGDEVRIGVVTGIVQEVGLRVTKVLDADGVVWYIRNGEMTTVGNATQAATSAGGPGPTPR